MSGAVASAYAEVGFRDAGVAEGLAALNQRLHGWQSNFVAVMSGGVIGHAFSSFIDKIRGVATEMDKLAKRAKETRTPIEQLSEMEFAGKLSGVENMAGLLNFLTKNLGLAAGGNKELAESFEKLGIDAAEFVRSGQPAANLLGLILDRLRTLAPAAAHATSMQLFGRSGFDVMRLGTGADFAQSLADARRSGATVTSAQAAAAEKFNDELEKMGERANAVWRDAAQPILEASLRFLERLEGKGSGAKLAIESLGESLAWLIDKIGWAADKGEQAVAKLAASIESTNVQPPTPTPDQWNGSTMQPIPMSVLTNPGGYQVGNDPIVTWLYEMLFGSAPAQQAASPFPFDVRKAGQQSGAFVDAVGTVAILSKIEANTAKTADGVAQTPDPSLIPNWSPPTEDARKEAWYAYSDALSALRDKQYEMDAMNKINLPAIMDAGSYWSTAQGAIKDDTRHEQLKVAKDSLERLAAAVNHLEHMAQRLDEITPNPAMAP